MSRMISFWLLIGVIIVVGVVFYRVMAGFLLPLFLAALLVVIFRPMYRWVLEKVKGRQRSAALLTTASVLLVVLGPASIITLMAAIEGRQIYKNVQNNLTNKAFQHGLDNLREQLDLYMPMPEDLRFIEDNLDKLAADALTSDENPKHHNELIRVRRRADSFILEVRQTNDWAIKSAASKKLIGEKWESFRSGLGELEQLSAADWGEQEEDMLLDYQDSTQTVAKLFREFKLTLLNGPVWAAAKEMANPSKEEFETMTGYVFKFVRDWLLKIGSATTSFVLKLIVTTCITMISMYFFLLDGPKMVETLMRLSPLDDRHEQELINEFDQVSRAVVVATLLSAVVQGMLAGIGYYFAGLESVFLLMLITTVLAMVPFVGAASVWVPCCLWLYLVDGRFWPALLLAIYGFFVISMADNVIKPLVLHGQSKLHPLLALLSVLGGVQALGPIGILVGPMVVVFLQTQLNILQRELMSMDGASETATDSST